MRILLLGALLAVAPLLSVAQQDETPKPPPRPEVGAVAPTFRLNDQAGKALSIGGNTGTEDRFWTVLAFFPKAATPG